MAKIIGVCEKRTKRRNTVRGSNVQQVVQIITTRRLTVNVHEEIWYMDCSQRWTELGINLQRTPLRFGCTHSVVTHDCDAEQRSFHKMARLELNTNRKYSFLQ